MNTATLTVTETATRLGVHRNAVRKMVLSGRLPAEKQGRCVLIPVAAVEKMTRRTCLECGKAFAAHDPRRAFCSAACRYMNKNRRVKAARPPAQRGSGRPSKSRPAPTPVPDRLIGVLDVLRNLTAPRYTN